MVSVPQDMVGTQHDSGRMSRPVERRSVRPWDETKPSFKTTELLVMILAVAGVLIASRFDDSLDGRWAWTLVAVLAVGYMVSRGLAKAGSSYRDDAAED